jgi:hypothetical protein
VEEKKLDYVNSKRLDKPLVALEIIRAWRAQEPPGRFLKNDEKTGLWEDVGDKKAREKTSQALRERAPEIRRKQEEEEDAMNQEKGEVRRLDYVCDVFCFYGFTSTQFFYIIRFRSKRKALGLQKEPVTKG